MTSYFNPARFKRRLEIYRIFRRCLSVPLVTVELSFDGVFELTPDDADILIQLRATDVMWQKERLLDLAVQALPVECRYVACLDCDIIFRSDDWEQRTIEALHDFPLVQAFSQLHHLPRDTLGDVPENPPIEFSQTSLAAHVGRNGLPAELLGKFGVRRDGEHSRGIAWAWQREVLERYRHYDRCIIGGGDTAVICAAFGRFDEVVRAHAMNGEQREYYMQWARPVFDAIQGHVSYVDGEVLHLWHGEMSHRQSRERHVGLAPFAFSPRDDVSLDESGCLRWNSTKPALHSYVSSFFQQRQEDG